MNKERERDAVIVSVARTPVGNIKGTLASITPPELSAIVLNAVVEKVGIAPEMVDDIIFANLFDSDWGDLGRCALLQAGFPESVSAVTIDRQCSSSLNALAMASSLIHDGACDIMIVGGVESYSQRPIYIKKPEKAYPDDLKVLTYKTTPAVIGHPTMIQTAENLAQSYSITRDECDMFAFESHKKSAKSWTDGLFAEQIVPVAVPQRKGEPIIVDKDECVRFDASLEAMSKLKPIQGPDGVVTAGNSSPRNDGAAAVLVLSREKANDLGLTVLAVVKEYMMAGVDPYYMGIGPVEATRKLMVKYGYKLDDFDLIELNEAFASQSIACIKELRLDQSRVNVEGGAIAIGHPNAASGAILTARMVYALKHHKKHRGLISFCVGGGQGFSLVIENEEMK